MQLLWSTDICCLTSTSLDFFSVGLIAVSSSGYFPTRHPWSIHGRYKWAGGYLVILIQSLVRPCFLRKFSEK